MPAASCRSFWTSPCLLQSTKAVTFPKLSSFALISPDKAQVELTRSPPSACQFSRLHYCHSHSCRCFLDLHGPLNCSSDPDDYALPRYTWSDHTAQGHHQVVLCTEPELPNPSAQVLLTLDLSELPPDGKVGQLLTSLANRELVSLDLNLAPQITFPPDFRHLTTLRRLSIQEKREPGEEGGGVAVAGELLWNLSLLQVLRLTNLSGPVEVVGHRREEGPAFARELIRYALEGLPRLSPTAWGPWLAHAHNLRRVLITRTPLNEARHFFAAPLVKSVVLSRNAIRSLNGAALSSSSLEELDLSYNAIQNITGQCFGEMPKLGFLDLSNNPITDLPPRAFEKLIALKFLNLDYTRITSIGAGQMLGLSALTHLSLQGNPQLRLEPFSLLPLSSVETMDLRHCNLTHLPEATTQACSLRRIWFNYNLIHSAEAALPPETVLQLIRLRQLTFSENPLLSNPLNLLLLPRDNLPLLHSVLLSLKQVPVWWLDPCTQYIWHLHLVEDPSLTREGRDTYAKLFSEDPSRRISEMQRVRCRDAYHDTMSRLSHYQSLVVTGRCETVRRLRSLDDRLQAQQKKKLKTTSPSVATTPTTTTPLPVREEVEILREEPSQECPSSRPLTLSLLLNVFLSLALATVAGVAICRRYSSCWPK